MPFLVLALSSFKNWKLATRFGWWFGFGHFLTSLFWIGNSFLAQSEVPIWAAPIAVIAMSYILAYCFYFTFGMGFLFKGSGWAKILAFAALWSLVEWVRGHIFTGFPWNPLGVIWTPLDFMMQPASIFGVYGLTFFTILIPSSLGLFLFNKTLRKNEIPFLISNLIILIFLFCYGFFRLESAEVLYHPNINFRVVQANIPQKEKWVRKNWSKNFYKHIQMSKEPDVNNLSPTFVIWPETAIPYFIGSEPGRRVLLAEMLDNKTSVISGAPRIEKKGGTVKLFNSVHVIGKDGRLAGSYDKVHLVPFGEYLPLRGVLGKAGLKKLTEGALDFSPGKELSLIKAVGIP
ncbi:MAG: apolipoprotein N-acyltransferase, partial [Sphingomonadales bacterium]